MKSSPLRHCDCISARNRCPVCNGAVGPIDLPGQVQHSTGPDTSQLDMDAVPSLNEDKFAGLNRRSRPKGLTTGPIDGIIRAQDGRRHSQFSGSLRDQDQREARQSDACTRWRGGFGRTGRWRAGSVLALNCRNYPRPPPCAQHADPGRLDVPTTSPGLSHTAGLRWTPAPVGVPVPDISPGLSVAKVLM